MTTPRLERRKKQFARSWRARDQKSHARFSRRMNNQNTPWFRRTIGQGVFLVLLVIGWLGLLLYHPYFQVTSVRVDIRNGDNETEYTTWVKQYLEESHLLSLSNSFFALKDTTLAEELRLAFPIQSLEVTKVFPHTIQISVEEEQDELLVYDHNGFLARVFTNGVVEQIPQSKTPHVQEIIPIEVSKQELTEPGSDGVGEGERDVRTEHVFSHSETFLAVRRLFGETPVVFANLPKENIEMFTKEFIYFTTQVMSSPLAGEIGRDWFFVQPANSIYQFELRGTSDWKIIFDRRFSFDDQLQKLFHVVQTRNIETIEKIDVRYGNSIFVTNKSAVDTGDSRP